MTATSNRSASMRAVLAGTGGGLASIVLAYSAIRGHGGLSIMLLPLVPLPTLIVGLGWGMHAAIAAMITAAVLMALVTAPTLAIGQALMLGIPAAGVTHLATLARYDNGGFFVDWFPVGRIVAAITLYGAALPVLLIAIDGGSYEPLRADLDQVIRQFIAEAPAGSDVRALGDKRVEDLVSLWLTLMPALIGCYWTMAFLANVYLAGRAVTISGLTPRTWPNLHWLTVPKSLAAALLAAILGIAAGGSFRVIGTGALGALLVAFLVQGLSFVHGVAHARSTTWAISATYVTLVVLSGIAMPVIALLGLAEVLFRIREQIIARPTDLPPGSI